jgi:competence protein ComEC
MRRSLIMRHCGFMSLVGGVLGVALQLQQPALWALSAYLALLAAGGLGVLGPGFTRRVWPAALLAGALLAGALMGFGLTGARAVWYLSSALDPALQGVDIEVTGRIASLPQRSAQGERFELVVESAARAGEAVKLPHRLQLGWYGGASAQPEGGSWSLSATSPGLRAGERWRFTVRLRSPHGNANPHGFDRERWLWEQGIQATGYVRAGPRDPVPQRLGATLWHPLDTLRQTVTERIEARVADDLRSAGVLAALVVGDQSAIERADWELFRTTGVAHLMSISRFMARF